VQSIAAVPVGLTKFREGLEKLEPYNKDTAGEVIDIIEEYSDRFRQDFGVGLCYPADEFFIKAERDLPSADYYDDYPQLDNGVGLVRSFYDDFLDELGYLSEKPINKKVTLATGADFYPYLADLCKKAEAKYGVKIQVKKIINNFFGETITVSGLITGIDLYEQLKDLDLGDYLLLPSSMISDYTNHTENKNKFLDDMTVEELEENLNVKIVLTNGGGGQLLRDILGVK
jgi:NifB/MoaA-like Fe-S oxidoreductase